MNQHALADIGMCGKDLTMPKSCEYNSRPTLHNVGLVARQGLCQVLYSILDEDCPLKTKCSQRLGLILGQYQLVWSVFQTGIKHSR